MSFNLDYTISHLPNSIVVPNPPGYSSSAKEVVSRVGTRDQAKDAVVLHSRKSTELKLRRAWDLALAPAKALPMQAFMLYMSGSGIQIFSIGMIFNLLLGPITSVFGIFNTFEAFRLSSPEPTGKLAQKPSYASLTMPMLAYIACQGLVFALGIYKCASMGILPTNSADWLQFESRDIDPNWSAVRAAYLG